MSKTIKIGTRKSPLALYQARLVARLLEYKGISSTLVEISSEGDENRVTPLYEVGITGVFTKTLDSALLEGRIDVAVHSLKDVPTRLAKGLCLASVPERATSADVVLYKSKELMQTSEALVVGSSSLRRKAQWLYRRPQDRVVPLRGNVGTRIQSLYEEDGPDAIILAEAGVSRLQISYPYRQSLDWMIPAAAQGAIGLVCREEDNESLEQCARIDKPVSRKSVRIERDFLRVLNAGCSMPFGVRAGYRDNRM